jgi:putative PIG3 family NAD(P)H quinone oxidoreductase
MLAIHIVNEGPDATLERRPIEKPVPGPGELLVRVRATALNRADLLQRTGKYPPPPGESPILGLEMAGAVEAWGASCRFDWTVGDRVCGLLAGGGYAEYVVLSEAMAMPIPETLSFEEAAAVPEVFLTAFQALFLLGGLEEGGRVLVHAGASGVGTAAIQLARQAGADVYVTASAGKHDACLSLGAKAAIDYRNENFYERVDQLTDGGGVQVVVDFIGAPYFEQNIQSLAMDGRRSKRCHQCPSRCQRSGLCRSLSGKQRRWPCNGRNDSAK